MASEHNIELVQADGMTLIAKADSGHWVVLDLDESNGGTDAASRPFETFLMSVAGCTAVDTILILKKMQVSYKRFSIKLHATRREEHPRIPDKMKIEYIIEGENIPEDMVKKAISMSQEKYCSVSAVVKMAGIPVEWSYKIIGAN